MAASKGQRPFCSGWGMRGRGKKVEVGMEEERGQREGGGGQRDRSFLSSLGESCSGDRKNVLENCSLYNLCSPPINHSYVNL